MRHMEKRLRELFGGIDADGNGMLSREELSSKLKADDELQKLMEGAGRAAHYVFEQLDADGDGNITVDEVRIAVVRQPAAMPTAVRIECLGHSGDGSIESNAKCSSFV